MLKNKKFLLIAILASVVCSLGAQTNSPYSRYGYGILRDQAVGPSKGMGGIGYGLRNSLSANPMNPASYSKVDSLTFLFDFGIYTTQSKLSDGVSSQSDNNGGLDYVTALMPLSKRLGLSFGILPFSSVGYSFGSTNIKGDPGVSYLTSYNGSGGLSQVYVGLGYETPIKGLSVGANGSFLFGRIEHSSSLAIAVTNSTQEQNYDELSIKTLKADFGVQYELPLSKSNTLVLGAVYTPKFNSTGNFENRHYVVKSTGALESGDTTNVNGVDAGLPETFGLGFTLNRNRNLVVGADVMYQKWENVRYSSLMGDGLKQAERFNNRLKFSVGSEYMIDPYDRNFIKKVRFRGGLNYANSYMNVKNSLGNIVGYKEYGATVGFGIPLRDRETFGNRTSYVNINFEYKKLKPNAPNMISEQYFGVAVNVNMNELWFFKRKID